MGHNPGQQAAQKGRASSAAKDRGKGPLGIQKRRRSRAVKAQTSRRLAARATEQEQLNPAAHDRSSQRAPSAAGERGTKRRNDLLSQTSGSIHKRPRPSPRSCGAEDATSRPDIHHAYTADTAEPIDVVGFWTQENKWPQEYFQLDIEQLLAQKLYPVSRNRKRSNSATSTTPSDQAPRDEKSALYRDARYELLLQTKEGDQLVPQDTVFDDSIFAHACCNLQSKNEARVIQDISRLIVPSAETLALRIKSLRHLHLIESVNEGWNNSMPLTGTRPQPDYSVGFKRKAFSDLQLAKLSLFIGDFIGGDQSLFMATYYMYFPSFTCEVKCGAAALDVADRQNAHSTALAVRATTKLFRAVNREDEVHRHIQAFSISHDHTSVRIYGYYPVLEGRDSTKCYRHSIRKFDFTELDGKERWTAYRFTKNLYELWAPAHFKRLCSAIDQLPLDLSLPPAGFPQDSQSHHLIRSDGDLLPLPSEHASQSSHAKPETATPSTSFTGSGAATKRRGKE
ncbi:uncharacterized protein MAM_04437 [Metarhizium album ARSEF 1941]|uniref:DUF7924 domain-containing protein n=1 Tax=Metarhizium album (strain ARSEF 1941) TaxID=1081103 RepID=A0A0B2WVE2_METAS|nr:uncharacterized protein MAM_04437 [Metarhizium album ARSEF 1941]KHN97422.1 hypothetical protein MAM_04437 [Metarhizium album ARSEF 1941]